MLHSCKCDRLSCPHATHVVSCHFSVDADWRFAPLAPTQILICQNLRNNLQHPNEYLRGVTLRFLCRLQCEELLEPLVPSVLACLEHRHSYVRRHAVLAVAAIYKLPKGELLLPVRRLEEGGEGGSILRWLGWI